MSCSTPHFGRGTSEKPKRKLFVFFTLTCTEHATVGTGLAGALPWTRAWTREVLPQPVVRMRESEERGVEK